MRIRSFLTAAALSALIILPPAVVPAFAQEQKPQEMLSEGASLIVNAIELMLLAIPTYEAPEVLANGDIIIRRVQRDSDEKGSDKEGGDKIEPEGEKL